MTKRDIKFRLWDGRRLRPWEEISMFHMYCFDEDMTKKNDVWEEYTGLKDVNGVEIYDGDYLANERGKSRMIFKVEWFNGAWWVIPVTQYGSSQTLSQYMNRTVEIIGNVHQNPELLEV